MKHDNRKAVTAQIHIAKKQLGLDDDTYRQMIATTTGGKRSCADCSVSELHQVLQGLKNRGFQACLLYPSDAPDERTSVPPWETQSEEQTGYKP